MGSITNESLGALNRAVQLGQVLQELHPEMILYRGMGFYAAEIAAELCVQSRWRVTDAVARNAVRCALDGFCGSSKFESYEGLLTPAERKEATASVLARRNQEQAVTALVNRDNRVRSGTLSAIARGFVPYSAAEKRALTEAVETMRNSRGPQYVQIAPLLNERFHNGGSVRTPRNLRQYVHSLAR